MRSAYCIAFVVGALAAVVACSSFDSDDGPPPSPDGGSGVPDVSSPDPGPVADAADDASPTCPESVPVPDLVADVPGGITHLASDDSFVYWVDGTKTIQRRSVGTAGVVETVRTDATAIVSMVASAGYVVFVTTQTWASLGIADAGALNTLGGPVERLTAYEGTVFGMSAGYVFRSVVPGPLGYVAPASGVAALAANQTHVFFIAPAGDAGTGSAVFSVPQGGAASPTVAFTSATRQPSQLTVDGTRLFMLDTDRGEVLAAPFGGTETVLASGESGLKRIAAREAHVYYSSASGLRRVEKAGGGCKASLSNEPLDAFTLTATHAYFASGTKLVRVPR